MAGGWCSAVRRNLHLPGWEEIADEGQGGWDALHPHGAPVFLAHQRGRQQGPGVSMRLNRSTELVPVVLCAPCSICSHLALQDKA